MLRAIEVLLGTAVALYLLGRFVVVPVFNYFKKGKKK